MNRKAERLLAATDGLPDGAVLVEIGCVRRPDEIPSDGHSTVYLARAAKDYGWDFYSIDYSPAAVAIAQRLTDGAEVHCSDGATWLADYKGTIDFLYLDGSTDPGESLRQYTAARMSKHSTVVIDDVQQIGSQPHGKGDALLGLLERDGYRVTIHDTEPGYRMAVAKR